MSNINIEDFIKVQLRVGTVIEAEEVPGSDKLIKQIVDFGSLPVISTTEKEEKSQNTDAEISHTVRDDNTGFKRDIRQILSGIKQWYKPEDLVGKQFVYVTNLEPRMMMGMESQGMILCTDTKKPIPIKPSKKVPSGVKLR